MHPVATKGLFPLVIPHSFNELKWLLLDSPVLALFDPFLPTFMTTDVSDYGLGGMPSQIHPGKI